MLGISNHFGFYLTKRRNIALSVGLMVLTQRGNLGVDTFHVEYESEDYNGHTFRQSISSVKGINESAKTTNVSIPILLKYKVNLSRKFFLTLDGGLLINTLFRNTSKSNARFDYEAIYKMDGTGTKLTFLYDDGVNPGDQDWLITKKEFLKDNPSGNMTDYFNGLRDIGYNVGLNQSIGNRTGSINYERKSLGYLVQPALNYKLRSNTYLKLGFNYMSQLFVNSERKDRLHLTNNIGDYTSLMGYTTNVESTNYGITLGIGFYFNSYIQKTYDHHFNVQLHK